MSHELRSTQISADGVIKQSGERLPDHEQLTQRGEARDAKGYNLCRQTGERICHSDNLCAPCQKAYDNMIRCPRHEYTEAEIQAVKEACAIKWRKR